MSQSPPDPALNARFAEALKLQHAGQVPAAMAAYRQLIPLMPDHEPLLLAAGTAELQLGHDVLAIRLLEHALQLNPGLTPAHANIAVAYQKQNQLDLALLHVDKALEARPDGAPMHINRGNILRVLERREEALAAYDAALRKDPDYAPGYSNRGVLKREMGDLEGALADFDVALARMPNYSEAWNNKGTTLRDLGRPAEALAAYTRAVQLRPDNASARWQKGAMELLLGDYEHGWQDFQARWQSPKLVRTRPDFPQPEWLGQSDPAGKTVLVYAEQGLGDTIQFSRFVPELEARGAKVILEVQSALVPLLRTLPAPAKERMLIGMNAPKPAFDLQVPLMSLPLALGTRVDTIPAAGGYLFPDPEKRAQWQNRLGPKTKPRIGLCWSGREGYAANRWRNIPVEAYAPLLDPRLEFHALQKEVSPPDRAPLNDLPAIRPHMDDLGDFSDTAALMDQMDLIITVDTSIAHVAGALGKPVWIITPQRPEWRWLMDRADTPWYASARLFRPKRNQIGALIADIQKMLAKTLPV